jgi:NTP pyrophosphatase (non-canonical NTP hydrolase)
VNYDEEIMTILGEECAEVIVELSKVKRFGLIGNFANLKKELCDLQCMINLMEEFDVISYNEGERFNMIQEKREKLKKFSRIFESNSGFSRQTAL